MTKGFGGGGHAANGSVSVLIKRSRLRRAAFLRDVRPLLGAVAVPTLVLHRAGSRYIQAGAGRYLAEHIPDATYVELPGDDQLLFAGDTHVLLDEIEEFLTGGRQPPEGDIVTATVLFTDIVASTEQSVRLGQRKWSSLIDDHDAMVRATLNRYRGHEVKTIGDGFLATFDATNARGPRRDRDRSRGARTRAERTSWRSCRRGRSST